MNLPNINLTFICINNETAAKFYLKGDSLRKGFNNLIKIIIIYYNLERVFKICKIVQLEH